MIGFNLDLGNNCKCRGDRKKENGENVSTGKGEGGISVYAYNTLVSISMIL